MGLGSIYNSNFSKVAGFFIDIEVFFTDHV